MASHLSGVPHNVWAASCRTFSGTCSSAKNSLVRKCWKNLVSSVGTEGHAGRSMCLSGEQKCSGIQKIRIHKAGKKHTEQKGCRKSIGLASFNTHEWYEFPKYAFCCRERLDRCTLPVRSGTKPWAGEAVSQSSSSSAAAKVSHASVMPQQWISQKPRKCFPIFCPTAFAPFLQKVQVRGGRMINLASFSVQTPLKTVERFPVS